MSKELSIEEIQNEIIDIQKWIDQKQQRISELKHKMIENKNMKSTYKKQIDMMYKDITKYNNQIEQFKYQISIGGRKLKTAIAISKDLIAAGFKKGEYTTSSMVRGWGDWRGEFTVRNEPKSIFINWLKSSNERFEEFYNYLVSKYGDDVSKDEFKNITIMK